MQDKQKKASCNGVFTAEIPRTILIENAIFKSDEFSFDSSSTLNKLFLNSCEKNIHLLSPKQP